MGRARPLSHCAIPRRRLSGGLVRLLRSAVPYFWRWAPRRFRYRSVYLRGLNRMFLAAGADPIVTGHMRLGHRLRLDLRSGTEWLAYYTGEFDDRRIATVEHVLRGPNDDVVDAGANIGLWSVPLARHLAGFGGRLFAIEPVPSNAARLRQNLRLNGLDSVAEVCQVAVSDRPGRLSLTLREDFEGGADTGNAAVLISDDNDSGYATMEVEAVSLDDLLATCGNPRIRLIKADLEGHEDRFLAGAVATLRRCRPVVVIEWNIVYYRRRAVDVTAAVSGVLDQLAYRCLRFSSGTWITSSRFASPKPVDDLLLVPGEEVAQLLPVLHKW